ncbi:MAG: TldD/PmbA family protein [Treponema sp.]|nr:TldD/PmbA family protein [Treponema sp.]
MIFCTETFTKKARQSGIGKLRFHIEEIEKQDISVFNGAVENKGASSETLIFVEAEYSGFIGSSYTETGDESVFPSMIENIIRTAELNAIPFIEKPIHDLPGRNPLSINFDVAGICEELLKAEKTAKSANEKLKSIFLNTSIFKKNVTLLNGEGSKMTDESRFLSVSINAIAKAGEQVQTAYIRRLLKEKPDYSELALSVASEASKMLNSEPCFSGTYKAVFRNNAFAEVFGAFLPAFYAEKCQNNMSFMAGKIAAKIGSSSFTAFEAPDFPINRRFDDEGTLTSKKTIVDKGTLSAYFHNTSTAAKEKDGKSTGNGYRQDYKESISTSYTNVFIEPGSRNLDELLKEMNEGILITACDGVFAGVNPVSGDFSVISKGYMVRRGELCEPVSGITVGGNLLGLLASVEEAGNDTAIVRANTGIVGSPSVRLSGLLVSGKTPVTK